MRKSVSFLSIGLILAVLAACDQSSVSSVPPEDMILIPAGEFIMGTDSEEANADQKPAHQVYLDAFYIDKYEVTNAQYEEFILAGGYKKREFWTEEGWGSIQKFQFDAGEWHKIEVPMQYGENSVSTEPDHPVIGVSWYEANAYATWVGKRLPTEAEWEKAARGIDGRTYPWGNEMDFSRLNYFSHHEKILGVGSFLSGASPYGVLDMAGSVWEWCADWYGESRYSHSPQKNPTGPNKGQYRVLRGGGWDSIRLQLRCPYRYYEPAGRRTYNIGFRCVQDISDG
ncbi:formylglycine-generating enzyme family protein [Candidatus Poribacteria bacterium]|nr:formylglycine-generating enzyme family protein [Candidatus Poribacteria bacterium]